MALENLKVGVLVREVKPSRRPTDFNQAKT